MSLRRGDVFWVDFEPVVGHEQGGVRPAVVVQNDTGNTFSSTTIVAAITTRLARKPFPFLVAIPEGVLPRVSAVNCSDICTIDQRRVRPERLGRLDDATMHLVDRALMASLGIT